MLVPLQHGDADHDAVATPALAWQVWNLMDTEPDAQAVCDGLHLRVHELQSSLPAAGRLETGILSQRLRCELKGSNEGVDRISVGDRLCRKQPLFVSAAM